MRTSSRLLVAAALQWALAAADFNALPSYNMSLMDPTDKAAYQSMFALPECTTSGNGTNIGPGLTAAINLANGARHNTDDKIYSSYFGSCDRTVVDGVFQAMLDGGPNFEKVKCVPNGYTNKFLPCGPAAIAISHDNPDGSSSIYLCPGCLNLSVNQHMYPDCQALAWSIGKNQEPDIGLGGILAHEMSHRMNVPGGRVVDGPPSMNNQSCYTTDCVQTQARGPTCTNTQIAQAYALYAAAVHCANGGTNDAPAAGAPVSSMVAQPAVATPASTFTIVTGTTALRQNADPSPAADQSNDQPAVAAPVVSPSPSPGWRPFQSSGRGNRRPGGSSTGPLRAPQQATSGQQLNQVADDQGGANVAAMPGSFDGSATTLTPTATSLPASGFGSGFPPHRGHARNWWSSGSN